MPVKRRNAKRQRLSEAEELEAFDSVFRSGFDFFDDLGFGSGRETYDLAREEARKVWPQLGARFLGAYRADPGSGLPWALEEFGEPPCR